MRYWGKRSMEVYHTLHPTLQHYVNRVRDEVADISLICGYRDEEAQNKAFDGGFSKVRWPHGNHNKLPSTAVDIQPVIASKAKIKLSTNLSYIAGRFVEMAKADGVTIRWGGDWDQDGDLTDQTFDDLFHFELVENNNNDT